METVTSSADVMRGLSCLGQYRPKRCSWSGAPSDASTCCDPLGKARWARNESRPPSARRSAQIPYLIPHRRAKITSWPRSCSCSLIQIECVSASIATRAGGGSVNHFSIALGVVRKRPRPTTSPSSLRVRNGSRHHQDQCQPSACTGTV